MQMQLPWTQCSVDEWYNQLFVLNQQTPYLTDLLYILDAT